MSNTNGIECTVDEEGHMLALVLAVSLDEDEDGDDDEGEDEGEDESEDEEGCPQCGGAFCPGAAGLDCEDGLEDDDDDDDEDDLEEDYSDDDDDEDEDDEDDEEECADCGSCYRPCYCENETCDVCGESDCPGASEDGACIFVKAWQAGKRAKANKRAANTNPYSSHGKIGYDPDLHAAWDAGYRGEDEPGQE